jgi:hypothetical protein
VRDVAWLPVDAQAVGRGIAVDRRRDTLKRAQWSSAASRQVPCGLLATTHIPLSDWQGDIELKAPQGEPTIDSSRANAYSHSEKMYVLSTSDSRPCLSLFLHHLGQEGIFPAKAHVGGHGDLRNAVLVPHMYQKAQVISRPVCFFHKCRTES